MLGVYRFALVPEFDESLLSCVFCFAGILKQVACKGPRVVLVAPDPLLEFFSHLITKRMRRHFVTNMRDYPRQFLLRPENCTGMRREGLKVLESCGVGGLSNAFKTGQESQAVYSLPRFTTV